MSKTSRKYSYSLTEIVKMGPVGLYNLIKERRDTAEPYVLLMFRGKMLATLTCLPDNIEGLVMEQVKKEVEAQYQEGGKAV